MSTVVTDAEHELDHPTLGHPVAVYPYARSSGDVAFVVARFDPKDFRPAMRTDNGQWRWTLNGAPALLYQLPRVEDALAHGETIWIVDGEKDADALLERGQTATCCARSQGWSLNLADQLIGVRNIRIVADKDNGPGMKQALEVRDLLLQVTGIGSHEIEIVHAAEGKDAYDHFAAGHGIDDFELAYNPQQNGSPLDPDAVSPPETAPIIFETLRSFLKRDVPQSEALVGVARDGTNLLPRYGWVMPWGREGSGKTSILVDLLFHACAGIDWLGYPIGRALKIVAIVNEGVPGGLQDKLRQKTERWEHSDTVLDNLAVYASPWGEFTFANERMAEHAQDFARDFGADYVAMDPLHTLGTTGVGSPVETEAFKHVLRTFGLWDWIGVITAHHSNKAGMLSGDWGRHPDTVLHLEKDGKAPATKLTLQKARPADPTELGNPYLLEWETDTLGYSRVDLQTAASFDEDDAFQKAADALSKAAEPLRKGDLVEAIGQTAEHARKAVDKWIRDGRIVDLTPTKRSFKLTLPRSVETSPTEHDGTLLDVAQIRMDEPNSSVGNTATEQDQPANSPEGASSVVRRSPFRETTEEDRTERASYDHDIPF